MKSKKIFVVFLIALMIIVSNMNFVYASSFSVNLASERKNYAAGQTVVITVSLSDIDSSNGIYELSGYLDYDTSVFEEITSNDVGVITSTESKMVALGNWASLRFNSNEGEYKNKFSIGTTDPATSDESIMQILLKVKEDAPLDNTTIMLKNLEGSDSVDDITTSPATVSVNIKDISEIEGDDPIPVAGTTPSPEESTTPSAKPSALPVTKATVSPTPTSKLPQTGIQGYTVPVLIGALIIALVAYVAYRRYKGI